MKRTVAKYLLSLRTNRQEIKLPLNSKILSMDIKGGCVYLYAAVDTTKLVETKVIAIVATGAEIPENAIDFISTATGGPTEWHFFELDS